MRNIPATIDELETALREKGVRIDAVLSSAEISRSTWTRWKCGPKSKRERPTNPRLDLWVRVNDEIEKALENPSAYGGQENAA